MKKNQSKNSEKKKKKNDERNKIKSSLEEKGGKGKIYVFEK